PRRASRADLVRDPRAARAARPFGAAGPLQRGAAADRQGALRAAPGAAPGGPAAGAAPLDDARAGAAGGGAARAPQLATHVGARAAAQPGRPRRPRRSPPPG